MFIVIAALFVFSSSCFPPPVPGPIVEAFDAPPCEFCAGHRGIELAPPHEADVRAVAGGVVTFAGSVAGVRYVVVRHDRDDLVATYGKLDSVAVARDQVIGEGQVVGAVTSVLYFGLRRDGSYIDPEPYLGRIVRRPRLVPSGGGPGRPSEPGRLRCPSADPSPGSRRRIV